MTDETRLPDPVTAVRELPAGSAIILRHYAHPKREELARTLASLARHLGLKLLIGNDPKLARTVGAAGVHLPERFHLGAKAARWRADWLVTTAAHSARSLAAATASGADAALLSPVFTTVSHPNVTPLGPHRFTALVRYSSIPVYALGGIDVNRARLLYGSGAVGIAGIGGFMPERDP